MLLSLAISSLFCFILALLLNILLLFLLLFRPSTQLHGYRWISIAFIVTGLYFSLAYSIIVPLWHADGGLVLLIPVGFTSSLSSSSILNSLIRPAFVLWHAGMMNTSFVVAASFIFRYNIICHSKPLHLFFDSRIAVITAVCLSLVVSLGHGLVLDTFTSPFPALSNTLNTRVGSTYGLDFTQVYYQGVDRNDPSQRQRELISVIESGIFQFSFLLMLIIVLFTGRRIYSAIREGSHSKKAKKRQMHLFKMLVVQTISPLLFLYLPPMIDVSSLLLNYVLPFSLCLLKAFLVFMFPISNPLIIIVFTGDYRSFILRQQNGKTFSLSHASNVNMNLSVVSMNPRVSPTQDK